MPDFHIDDNPLTQPRPVAVDLSDAPDKADFGAMASGDASALAVGTRLHEFEITGIIGAGGFGIVYAAYDHLLMRRVALKEYMPANMVKRHGDMTLLPKSQQSAETFTLGMRRFINEAKLLAKFDHPSLVKVYRFWEANGTAYMIMPWYQGVTLRQALKDMPTPPTEAWLKRLLSNLCDALDIIHREQCFHRDIAPDNIILVDDLPILLDFGSARYIVGDSTQALTTILKPGYAPVEQYVDDGTMKQGPWTDIYSLAGVVYCAITGAPPISSVGRLVIDKMVPLSIAAQGRYSDAFLSGIDQALAVKSADRPQNVTALRNRLRLNGDEPESKIPVSPAVAEAMPVKPQQIQPAARVRFSRALALAALFTIGAAAIYFYPRSANHSSAPTPVLKPQQEPLPPPAERQSTLQIESQTTLPASAPIREQPPMSQEKPLPKPLAAKRIVVTPPTPLPLPPIQSEPKVSSSNASTLPAPAGEPSNKQNRCTSILNKLALGESISVKEKQELSQSCQ